MIRVCDLRVDYGPLCAVRHLSLEIAAGEVYGLIGPNGAGKTSTMRALLGLVEPTYGEIEMAGVNILERPEDAGRVIGYMPDFAPVYDDLTVWEFLYLFAASYFIPRNLRADKVDHYLDLVGLTKKRDEFITGLSRGMRQRLILAKTLLPEPQVLLLDEPASGMDPNGRADLKNAIRTLAAEGKTVLISSHILSEMSEFCTAVGIMEEGRLVVSGRVDEITAQVLGHGVLSVEVLDAAAELERIVRTDRRAGALIRQGNVFEFSYDGDARAASDLLARLVGAGVRVASFARKQAGLEEVFLKVGARELS
jgi:ABC-2 type transport system ATP-binding protein